MCILLLDDNHEDASVLVQIFEDPKIQSLRQLFWKTHQMVVEHHLNPNRTIVFGPISDRDPVVVRSNLEALSRQAKKLSDSGWVVVDIASYYDITERLIRACNVSGYPYVLLREFTFPLIHSELFKTLYFRSNYETSVGATHEHDYAVKILRVRPNYSLQRKGAGRILYFD